MRKMIAVALAAGLATAVVSGPAIAGKGKTKTVHKTFSAGPHAPAPILGDAEPNGCFNSVDGVNKTTINYKTPGTGTLSVKLMNFEGDWDLFVADSKGNVLAASDASQLTGDAPEENISLPLGKKQSISIVACNWAGGPTAEGHYTYKYKK